jgi:cobalt-zinc-cadmium efflux system membrane fusion protein
LAALFGSPVSKTQPKTGTTSAEPGTAESVTIAQGRIEVPTSQKLFASAPLDGRIRRIVVEHGQSVRKGQQLAELESLEFQSLQLDLIQARATLTQASANLERLKNLAASDAIARKDLWELQTQHDVTKHSVETLRRKLSVVGLSVEAISQIEKTDLANLDSAQELSSVLPIRAPGDGLIAEFNLVPGQVVERQRSLFEIHDPSKMWVRAYLFEQDAQGVKIGQVVHVTLVADPAFRATGKVDRISPVLVSGNRALSIWIELDNPNRQLKENMSAVVAVRTGKPGARTAEKAN